MPLELLESRRLLSAVPRFDHIVVVFEENHSASSIYANPDAPYLNALANAGAKFTQAYSEEHGSPPNYLALFSGSVQKANADGSYTVSKPNLATELKQAKLSFKGYAEAPADPDHDPWEAFRNTTTVGTSFSKFPADFTKLPTVSFISPNLDHDMHSASIASADHWAKANLSAYAKWAKKHNSLLIITWDEGDDDDPVNHIPTIIYGARVKAGAYAEHVSHYNMLRTIEDAYQLHALASSASATPITDIFSS